MRRERKAIEEEESGGVLEFARLLGTDFQVLLALRPVRTCFSRFPPLFKRCASKTAKRKNTNKKIKKLRITQENLKPKPIKPAKRNQLLNHLNEYLVKIS